MNGLLLLSLALTALVGALCTLLYFQQAEALRQIRLQKQMLTTLDGAFNALASRQSDMAKRIDQLATDVLQREIYQNSDDRHQLAIQSAKQGKGLIELTQRHGLSSDEAELIVSLYSPKANSRELNVKNANLVDPTAAEII